MKMWTLLVFSNCPLAGAGEDVTAGRVGIQIDNVAGDLGSRWPMYCGVPVPRGALTDTRRLRMADSEGQEVPAQPRRVAY
jgi:hypothetical protein